MDDENSWGIPKKPGETTGEKGYAMQRADPDNMPIGRITDVFSTRAQRSDLAKVPTNWAFSRSQVRREGTGQILLVEGDLGSGGSSRASRLS